MGRPYATGSVTDAEGGARAYIHLARLRKIAASPDVHCRHVPALHAAIELIAVLSRRNQVMGREWGAMLKKRALTKKGASIGRNDPDAAERIADIAADRPVIVYIGRDPRRFRVTTNPKIPLKARVIGRFDESTDYRVIARRVEEARAA